MHNTFKIIKIVLTIGIIIIFVMLVRDYLVSRYVPEFSEEASGTREIAVASRSRNRFEDYGAILERGLFSPAGILTAIDLSEQAPFLTDGSITLVGIVFGPSKRDYAIFEERESRKQELLRRGDQVFNSGILTGIEKDRALVTRGGRTGTFLLLTDKNENLNKKRPGDDKGANIGGFKNKLVLKKISDNEWVINQRALADTLNDIDKVLTAAILLPYMEGKSMAGFRITNIKSDGIFKLIGLKEGDILKRVNNYDVDSVEKGLQLLSGLKGESNMSLDILRNGKSMNLRYQIR